MSGAHSRKDDMKAWTSLRILILRLPATGGNNYGQKQNKTKVIRSRFFVHVSGCVCAGLCMCVFCVSARFGVNFVLAV